MNGQWLRERLLANWGLKLVSLLSAFLIWFFVVGQEQREEYFKIRLLLENTPEHLVVTSRVPEFISLRLIGPRTLLSNVRARLLTVSLNLSGMQEGTSTYEILPSRLSLPRGVEVADISPAVVTLQGDRKAVRTLRIKPRLIGAPAGGYEISDARVTPAEARVEGAEQVLKSLKEIPTEFVDVTGLEGNLSRKVALAPPEPSLRPLDEKPFVLDVKVREQQGERGFLRVEVQAPPGWAAKPPVVEVQLSGSLAVLSKLTAKDISAQARPATKGPGSASLEVVAPPGTRVAAIVPAEVRLAPATESVLLPP